MSGINPTRAIIKQKQKEGWLNTLQTQYPTITAYLNLQTIGI
jgi:hypothetical protein